MSDDKKPMEVEDNKTDDSSSSLIAIDVVGKDQNVWDKSSPRFLSRIIKSLRSLYSSQVPGRGNVHDEAKQALENAVASGQEIIKKPQLINLEKMAGIEVKLSQAKLNEALAMKAEAEANKINRELALQELEVEQVQYSQRVIDALIKRGELYPMEKDGQLTFIYQPKKKL